MATGGARNGRKAELMGVKAEAPPEVEACVRSWAGYPAAIQWEPFSASLSA
jgi:hypothetical protein